MKTYEKHKVLQAGTPLHWYEVVGVLGAGGFGITYEAMDTTLNQRVAIKEFFPRSVCVRGDDQQVSAVGEHTEDDFRWGLRRFLEEARTLASFSHPNIVRVLSAFELHGTAYMVMVLERGQTIAEAADAGKLENEDVLLHVIGRLLEGVEKVHEAGFIHRDIKPDNILLREDGMPVLVDFGAAREIRDAASRGLTSLVSRGFAPFEQYTSEGEGRRQGPWGDIYSLAAVMYRVVTGNVPLDAVKRGMEILESGTDPLVPASEVAADRYSDALLAAIDSGLAFRLEERPLTIATWRQSFPALPAVRGNPTQHTERVEGTARNNQNPASPLAEQHSLSASETSVFDTESPTEAAPASERPGPRRDVQDRGQAFSNLSVLVVDDEPFVRNLALKMLERLGVSRLDSAESGRVALAKIEDAASHFDVVLCDLKMPDLDGIEFIRGIAGYRERPDVAFVSGVEERLISAAKDFALQNGLRVLGTLSKPIKPRALSALLELAMESFAPAQSQAPRRDPGYSLSREEVEAGLSDGALTMYYQPKVAVRDRHVVGFEALARWQHPEFGILGPGSFLPAAESNGLMGPLTKAVVARTLADGGSWLADGLTVNVSINVDADNLADLDFPGFVVATAAEQAMAPSQITLELTESGVARDAMAAMEILMRLRLNDITLSVDDFGTGYASLDKLKSLPFTELKIDRAFVHGAKEATKTHTLLESAVSLGKNLGLHIVAEGVEDQDDWDVVSEFGCDAVQGFLVARPMPVSEVPEWLAKWESTL